MDEAYLKQVYERIEENNLNERFERIKEAICDACYLEGFCEVDGTIFLIDRETYKMHRLRL